MLFVKNLSAVHIPTTKAHVSIPFKVFSMSNGQSYFRWNRALWMVHCRVLFSCNSREHIVKLLVPGNFQNKEEHSASELLITLTGHVTITWTTYTAVRQQTHRFVNLNVESYYPLFYHAINGIRPYHLRYFHNTSNQIGRSISSAIRSIRSCDQIGRLVSLNNRACP